MRVPGVPCRAGPDDGWLELLQAEKTLAAFCY